MKRNGWPQRVLGGFSHSRRRADPGTRARRLEVRPLEARCLPATFAVPPAIVPIAQMVAGPSGDVWYDRTSGPTIGHIAADGTVAEFDDQAGVPPQDLETDVYGNLW